MKSTEKEKDHSKKDSAEKQVKSKAATVVVTTCCKEFMKLIILCVASLAAQDYIVRLLLFLQRVVIGGLSEVWTGVLIIIAFLSLAVWLALRLNRNIYVQPKYITCATFVLLFYSYFRWIDNHFVFWTLGNCPVAYMDFIIVPYCVLCFQKFWSLIPQKQNTETGTARKLLRDAPISGEDEDIFGYAPLVKSLLADLRETDVSKRSFSVGIAGQWGVGKSSFLNLVARQVKGNDDILIEFTPRSSRNCNAINDDFFKVLAKSLARYNTDASNVVKKYVHSICTMDADGWLKGIMTVLDTYYDKDTKKQLEEVIEKIGRKIFIIIEDFDRLTAPEMLEVFKIIDRNGNFKNTYFITAYDKEYTNCVLRNYLGYEKSVFTDKYFNYEVALYAHDKNEMNKYVVEYLEKNIELNENDAVSKQDIIKAWNVVAKETISALGTMRNIKRFLNILMSRLQDVINDVNLVDFFRVTLLRYKDIEVYYMLTAGELVLKNELNQSVFSLRSDLSSFFKQRSGGWDGSRNILLKLFPENSDNLPKDYLKIRTVNSFDAYFYGEKKGKLYYSELRKLFTESDEKSALAQMQKMTEVDARSVEEFLISRNMAVLGDWNNLVREIILSFELYKIQSHPLSICDCIVRLISYSAVAEAVKYKIAYSREDYRSSILNLMSSRLCFDYPLELGGIIKMCMDEYRSPNKTKMLHTFREYQEIALACQKYYLLFSYKDDWNLNNALELSDIKQNVNTNDVLLQAKSQLLDYMKKYASSVVKDIYSTTSERQDNEYLVTVRFKASFSPKMFFPVEYYNFDDWIGECVKDHDISTILHKLNASPDNTLSSRIEAGRYKKDDNKLIAQVILQDDLDSAVYEFIIDRLGIDISIIAKAMHKTPEEIRASLKRLYQKHLISEENLKLKDKMEPFEIGDFVKLRNSKFETFFQGKYYKYLDNIFEIRSIRVRNGISTYRLKDINKQLDTDDIEAIPIDGVNDFMIYYTDSKDNPNQYNVEDQAYYLESLAKHQLDGKTYLSLIQDANCKFVHEVQHFLEDKPLNGKLAFDARMKYDVFKTNV